MKFGYKKMKRLVKHFESLGVIIAQTSTCLLTRGSTHTWIFFSIVDASILLALNLNAFFFFFAKNAAASAMVSM